MLKFIQQMTIHRRTRWVLLFLLSCFLIISLWQAPIVNLSKSNSEIRGIWITNYGVALNYYTTRLDEAVANIAKHRLNTVYPAVWNRGLQDWERWVNKGLLDEVIVQVYREELTSLKSELKNNHLLRIKNKIPVAIGLYTGLFLDAKSIEKVKQEVKIVQQSAYKGVSFFCWETTFWFFKGSSHDSVEQNFRKLFI